MEMTTEEVENYLKGDSRIIIKLPLFINNEFAVDSISAIIEDISKALGEDEIDVIVSSPTVLAHTRVDRGKYSKAKLCAVLIDKLHHDVMPYTEVIISVPKDKKGALKEICQKHGVSGIVKGVLEQ